MCEKRDWHCQFPSWKEDALDNIGHAIKGQWMNNDHDDYETEIWFMKNHISGSEGGFSFQVIDSIAFLAIWIFDENTLFGMGSNLCLGLAPTLRILCNPLKCL